MSRMGQLTPPLIILPAGWVGTGCWLWEPAATSAPCLAALTAAFSARTCVLPQPQSKGSFKWAARMIGAWLTARHQTPAPPHHHAPPPPTYPPTHPPHPSPLLQGILQEAVGRKEYWRLIDGQGRPPGVLGLWPSRAVTFLENHDTGELIWTTVLCNQLRLGFSCIAVLVGR